MDAAEFFRTVVKSNYENFVAKPNDFKLLWNAIVSMNTVAEFVALDRHNYSPISRGTLAASAAAVRDTNLADLKYCAETFKHVRKINDINKQAGTFTTVATSTGVQVYDHATWAIGTYNLPDVLERAYQTLSNLAELK